MEDEGRKMRGKEKEVRECVWRRLDDEKGMRGLLCAARTQCALLTVLHSTLHYTTLHCTTMHGHNVRD